MIFPSVWVRCIEGWTLPQSYFLILTEGKHKIIVSIRLTFAQCVRQNIWL